jgi:hypothetical protein
MRFRVLVSVLGFSCFACGGDDASPAPPADAGSNQTGGTGAGGSGGNSGSAGNGGSSGSGGNAGAGSGGDAGGGSGGTSAGAGGTGGGGAGGSAGQTVGEGYIFVQQSASQHQLLATFDVWTPMPLCTYREIGACRLDLCTPPTVHASAGQVGASVGTVTRTAAGADAGAGANQGTWPGQLWQPGETVRLFATGAEVPAFEETVPGPAPFTLIEPAPSAMIGVSRAQPLRVRWSGGDFGSAVVALVGMSVSAGSPLQVKCSFSAALGEGSVPAEALSDLDPAQRTTLVAFAEGYKRLDRGGWLLRVGARTTSVSATVVLQ